MRTVTCWGDNLRVLSVDPGGTTGWLLFRPVVDETHPTGYGIEPLDWGEERSQMRFLNQAWTWLTQPDPTSHRSVDAVVCEGWWPRAGNQTWEPEAVEIIGTLRWMMNGDPERFYVQQPSEANGFGTPAKIGMYRRDRKGPNNVGSGGEGHAVMALKHALLWTCTRWSPGEKP